MIALVYTTPSSRTGRVLGRAIGDTWGTVGVVNRRQQPITYIVRWGCSSELPFEPIEGELNSALAISTAADKYSALETMAADGVPTVPFSRSPAFSGEILRRRDFHRAGRDIAIGTAEDFFPELGVHFTQFVPSTREMRLHVFKDKVIRAQLKNPPAPESTDEIPIRTHTRGYTFVPYVRSWPHQTRCDTAIRAIKSLGLDFGAVDMLIRMDGTECVLEVNTAPACDKATAACYLEAISAETGCDYNETLLDSLSPETEDTNDNEEA
jgi:hypothetical protein